MSINKYIFFLFFDGTLPLKQGNSDRFSFINDVILLIIIDDPYAGCGSDTTRFPPLDLNFYWPPTLKGHRVQLPCCTSSSDGHMINVTRVCSEDGQWLEPIGLQDCYDDNVNELFDVISAELLNQVS